MRRLVVLALALFALGVLPAAAVEAATAPPVKHVICNGSCDSGGGIWVGGWCSNVGEFNITTTSPHYAVRCLPAHSWWYA